MYLTIASWRRRFVLLVVFVAAGSADSMKS